VSVVEEDDVLILLLLLSFPFAAKADTSKASCAVRLL
jgi:hypothetical protein